MPIEQYANLYSTNLSASATSGATTISVNSAPPAALTGRFRMLVDNEIMLVTGVSGTTLTVSRGQEGTTAAAHSSGAVAAHVATAASLKALASAGLGAASVTDFGATGNGTTDDTAAIHAARDALGANGTLIFPPGTYLVGQLNMNANGQTWIWRTGCTVKTKNATNTDALLISANDCTIEGGGTLDANSANQTGGAAVWITGDRGTLKGITVKNAYSKIVYLTDTDASRLLECVFAGSLNDGVFGETNATNTLMRGCRVTGVTAAGDHDAVGFHATTSGQSVDGTRIEGCYIESGSSSGFCIEIGPFGGNRPKRVKVSDCQLIGVANHLGGISLDNCDGATVTGNSYDSQGFVADIAGVELAGSNRCVVAGNYLKGVIDTTISIDRASYNAITGNVIDGYNPSAGVGIHLTSSQASQVADYNTISGNTIIAPATTSDNAIWVQSNATGAHCNGNAIVGNNLHGAGTNKGIKLETNLGAVDKTVIVGNVIEGFATDLDTAGGTNVIAASNN